MATRATCAALLVLLPHAESFIISSPALGLTDPSTRTVGAKNLRYSPLDSQPAHQRCVQTRNPLLDGTKRSRQCGPNMVMDPFVKDLFIGGLAGTVSNIIVFPVDLAKTKMQNAKDQTDKEKYGGFFTTVSSIVKEEGIHGLWSGSLPVLMGSAPESAIQLACHSWLVAFLLQGMSQEASSEAQLPLTLQIIAGGIAGASTLVATNPMEVLRIRAASSDQRCLITNVKSLGLLGLFAGYQATWLRDIPFAGIYFPLYCNMKVFLAQMLTAFNVPVHESLSMTMAGLFAGMFASYITTPADVIKTRIQTNIGRSLAASTTQPHPRLVAAFSTNDDAKSGCIKSTALSMVVEEGWHSFLCGVGPRVMRLAPGMAITLVIYETLQKFV